MTQNANKICFFDALLLAFQLLLWSTPCNQLTERFNSRVDIAKKNYEVQNTTSTLICLKLFIFGASNYLSLVTGVRVIVVHPSV